MDRLVGGGSGRELRRATTTVLWGGRSRDGAALSPLSPLLHLIPRFILSERTSWLFTAPSFFSLTLHSSVANLTKKNNK